MPVKINRIRQAYAILITAIFIAGFFVGPIGLFTNTLLALWFVGTQRPLRGFLWVVAFGFFPDLFFSYARPPFELIPMLKFVAIVALANVLGALPFLIHRLLSPRLDGLLAILPFPLAGALLQMLYMYFLPDNLFELLAENRNSIFSWVQNAFGPAETHFYLYLLLAALLWNWYRGRQNLSATGKDLLTASALFLSFLVVIVHSVLNLTTGSQSSIELPFVLVCFAGMLYLLFLGLFKPADHIAGWATRGDTLALMRSPASGKPLTLLEEHGRESLLSDGGERFPIKNGIAEFVDLNVITGSNKKYNGLYEMIGGFYDDTQRVWCLLHGFDQREYLRGYMHKLEAKRGDWVLETSVGTGLNLSMMPDGIHFVGLDLSPEMLANFQHNLQRWEQDADLILGNAEELPFADDSFDCVFHVGGINFFNDRAKAIREMIRVAKPGSLLLIADETEKHVQQVYENSPLTGRYFKKRKEPVQPPIDLVPPEMDEVNLDTSYMNKNFYVLTFRKPLLVEPTTDTSAS
jgi:ubiquinone/menaquinone biosynthesis C-methylase UbiE